jgi:hypothetical protein
LEEGCVEWKMRVDGADAVGSQQSHAMCAGDIYALLFKCRAFFTDFTKPCRDDDHCFDAAFGTIFDGLRLYWGSLRTNCVLWNAAMPTAPLHQLER